jgi:hypothetical protein
MLPLAVKVLVGIAAVVAAVVAAFYLNILFPLLYIVSGILSPFAKLLLSGLVTLVFGIAAAGIMSIAAGGSALLFLGIPLVVLAVLVAVFMRFFSQIIK